MLSGAIDVGKRRRRSARSTLVVSPANLPLTWAGKASASLSTAKVLPPALSDRKCRHPTCRVMRLQPPASGGFAAFPCNKVDLLSHIADRTPAAKGADIWGFMDLNTYREYVHHRLQHRHSGIRCQRCRNPREVGFVNGQTTTWRDIKVHQFWNATDDRWNAYAYITADNASDGLIIVDLRDLPHSISRINYASDFAEAHNVYLTDTDFSTGLSITGDTPNLILAGSNISDGRFRIYSLDIRRHPLLSRTRNPGQSRPPATIACTCMTPRRSS